MTNKCMRIIREFFAENTTQLRTIKNRNAEKKLLKMEN